MAAAAANGCIFGLKSQHKHVQSMGQLNNLNSMLLNQNYMNIKGDKKFIVNRASMINNTPEMAKSNISQSLMSSSQTVPPQFIHRFGVEDDS